MNKDSPMRIIILRLKVLCANLGTFYFPLDICQSIAALLTPAATLSGTPMSYWPSCLKDDWPKFSVSYC